MEHSQVFSRRRLRAAAALGVLCAAVGCGDSIVVYPVNGRVTVDGEPLHANFGTINFVPDTDKGNTTEIQPAGYLDEQGNYTMYYAQGKKGVPPGWYKVQIVASQLKEGAVPMPRPARSRPAPLFASKYTRADESGLEVEVVRDPRPGAYDLKLSK